jgi:hypothetical protein
VIQGHPQQLTVVRRRPVLYSVFEILRDLRLNLEAIIEMYHSLRLLISSTTVKSDHAVRDFGKAGGPKHIGFRFFLLLEGNSVRTRAGEMIDV